MNKLVFLEKIGKAMSEMDYGRCGGSGRSESKLIKKKMLRGGMCQDWVNVVLHYDFFKQT